jgi:hypothetical protein
MLQWVGITTHTRNMRNASRILGGITNGKRNSKDLVVDERAILSKKLKRRGSERVLVL